MTNFAVLGVGGYIASRHLRAIYETGSRLVAAADPKDSVGILDQYAPEARFFVETERLDRHMDKLRRVGSPDRVDVLSVCTPNYLHDAHCRLGLRNDADVVCEKPLTINPWNLDALEALEHETGRRIYPVLQLRYHPALVALRDRCMQGHHEVVLDYVTSRGPWYDVSWKGRPDKSGGVVMNIGIHFFDLLLWLFGPVEHSEVESVEPRRAAGEMRLARADVRWRLSIDAADLSDAARRVHRAVVVDGQVVEFSDGFGNLHTEVYRAVLDGRGLRVADARPAIELAYRVRSFGESS